MGEFPGLEEDSAGKPPSGFQPIGESDVQWMHVILPYSRLDQTKVEKLAD